VKIRFWGVRGSFAMSGRDFLRYGGNTCSVELQTAAGERLLIDLGTGATELAKALMGSEFGKGAGKLPILLSHTHLDHIQGLPFFTPFFIKGNQIRILGANPTSSTLEATLQNQLAPHYSPLNGLENLAAGVSIETLNPGTTIQLPGFQVTTLAVPHGSMWTTAYRISADGKTVTYLSDVEYPDLDQPLPEAIALALPRTLTCSSTTRCTRTMTTSCAAAGGIRLRVRESSSRSARGRRNWHCSTTAPMPRTT